MASTKYYVTTVSWYNQLKIKDKALVGISIICILFLIGLSLSIHLVNRIHEETREIHNKWLIGILKISEMTGHLDSFGEIDSSYVQAKTEEERLEIENYDRKVFTEFLESKMVYETLAVNKEEKILFENYSINLDEYFKIHFQLIENVKAKKFSENLTLLQKSKLTMDKVASDLKELNILSQRGAFESNKIADSSYYSLLFQMIVTSLLTILFIYLVIYYTFKQFIFPLQLAEKATARLAKGDWKVRIEYDSRDELGNFIRAFNQMVADHRKIDEEKTRIEKEIGRNEKLFRTLIELSPDAILLIGLDYSILWANTQMLKMFGYDSVDELHDILAIDFAVDSEKNRMVSIIDSLLNSDYNHYSYESEAIRKDKTPFPIEIQHAIYQNDNLNVGILTNIRDITERKQAEEVIVQNEERYRIITENMADVILVLDPTTMKLLYISPSVENLTDYSLAEIMSLNQQEFFTKGSLKYVSKVFPPRVKRLLAGKKSLNGIYIDELEQFKKDRTTIWTEVVSRYIINKNSGNPEIHAVVRNITERKKIQKEISEKSQMLGGILANMPVVVFRVDINGVITHCTGAGLLKMGLLEEHAVAMKIYEIFPEFSEELDRAFEGEPQVFISNGFFNEEIEWFFQNYFFLDESTNGLIGFGLDISEQVLAKKAAESASKIKGEFLANISHEIRTPMNAIIGFTEILKGLISDEIQKKYLENIFSSSKTLLALISDILDLSKVESGKLELQFSPISIKTIFMELQDIFSQQIDGKKLDFQIEIDPDLPQEIILDELRFRQIFLNLISNAIKFTEKGYVKLTAKIKKKTQKVRALDLVIVVEDTGIGIPKEEQSAIFEAFTQQRGQSHAKYGGTGLGLAISNRLAQLMNGTISVSSKVGTGSKFIVTFVNAQFSDENLLHSNFSNDSNDKPEVKDEVKIPDKISINKESIEELIPLLYEMKNDLFQEWEKLSDISSINEIEEFAYKIKYLGDKYNYYPLQEFAEKLESKALLFDMNSLLILLNEYNGLVENLEESYADKS